VIPVTEQALLKIYRAILAKEPVPLQRGLAKGASVERNMNEENANAEVRKMSAELVMLKNGRTEAKPLVAVLKTVLETLFTESPVVAYELVMKARDPNHQIWGNCADDLKALNLLHSDGTMHNSTRNIILSAVTGEGFDMILSDPIKQ
jgi:hypothetical protein